jgi:hypothetical protein
MMEKNIGNGNIEKHEFIVYCFYEIDKVNIAL